ncbi:hypothetical protein, partial [Mycoplasmopsis pullorum]|uniref:hypothetical protein n=1 Tax=Mycoplasmopsis pullorum TaxID=48003 RepID=UPI00111AC4C8
MKNWKRKWISLTLISSLTPLAILSASGCGGFNKTIISKFNEYKSKINVEKEIIVSEMSKISDFLNNKSANEYQNIDTYYFKIALTGLDLIRNYRLFINKLSENSQKYSELLNNETRDELSLFTKSEPRRHAMIAIAGWALKKKWGGGGGGGGGG